MKILFLTSRYPYPPIGGDKLRAYNIIKYLLSLGHEIHLYSLTDQPVQLSEMPHAQRVFHLPKVVSYLKSVRGLLSKKPLQVWFFHSRELENAVDLAIEKNGYDLIFCHLIRTAEYARNIKGLKRVIDLTDALSLSYSRISSKLSSDVTMKHFIFAFERDKVLAYEKGIIETFDKSIMISQKDKEYLGRYFDVSDVEIVPNGVNLEYFSFAEGDYEVDHMVFVGNMRTIPNCDAVMYFTREILPLIKKDIPGAKLTIVGTEPHKKVRNLAKQNDDIHVTGFVGDVRTYLQSASVSIAPMRYSAGIQNKILESMAIGTPVVTNSIGLEGIDADPGIEIFVEDSPEMFARRVVDLMKDDALRKSVSLAGRKLIEEKYSWGKVMEKLKQIIEG